MHRHGEALVVETIGYNLRDVVLGHTDLLQMSNSRVSAHVTHTVMRGMSWCYLSEGLTEEIFLKIALSEARKAKACLVVSFAGGTPWQTGRRVSVDPCGM